MALAYFLICPLRRASGCTQSHRRLEAARRPVLRAARLPVARWPAPRAFPRPPVPPLAGRVEICVLHAPALLPDRGRGRRSPPPDRLPPWVDTRRSPPRVPRHYV